MGDDSGLHWGNFAAAPGSDDAGWYLLARVVYEDGEGSDKAAVGISAHRVQADVSDEDNNSPDFNQNATTRSVPEDTVWARTWAP